VRFTEKTKLYLQQFAPAKRLIQFMNDALENCASETEKRQIANIILEKERLVDEIYNLVFQLPIGTELVILDLRYINDMTVEEVCSTLYISKSTYHKHHKNALKLLKEMREKK
jgi:DNA-directed RNA polymerase specialized sigma subunit